jgi:hypothetical protein
LAVGRTVSDAGASHLAGLFSPPTPDISTSAYTPTSVNNATSKLGRFAPCVNRGIDMHEYTWKGHVYTFEQLRQKANDLARDVRELDDDPRRKKLHEVVSNHACVRAARYGQLRAPAAFPPLRPEERYDDRQERGDRSCA